MKSFAEHLWESSISRITHHITNYGKEGERANVAIVSAHRGDNDPHVNNQQHAKLVQDLRALREKHGWSHIHSEGGYIENKGTPEEKHIGSEKSLMIIAPAAHKHVLRNAVRQLGEKYNQDSVLFHAHDNPHAVYIGTTHRPSADIKHGEEMDIGAFHPRQIGDYYTRHKNNKFSYAPKNESVEGWGYFKAPRGFFQHNEDTLY